jgi:hypothetical protein
VELIESQAAASNAGTSVPVPGAGLLEPQPEPDCLFPVEVDPKSDTADRAKLDYERLCYKHAEIVVRSRLLLLQDSVSQTIKTLNSLGRDLGLIPLEGDPGPAEGAGVPAEEPSKKITMPDTAEVVQAVPSAGR